MNYKSLKKNWPYIVVPILVLMVIVSLVWAFTENKRANELNTTNMQSKPIPGLKPGAFGLLHAWLTDSVYTDGYVIPSLDPLTLRNSHRPRDCRPKEIPPVQETPGV